MKNFIRYFFAFLLPGISMIASERVVLGWVFLIFQFGSYAWTIIVHLIGKLSAGLAMTILSHSDVSLLKKLDNIAPFIWLILALIAIYFVWKRDQLKKSAQASISSLS